MATPKPTQPKPPTVPQPGSRPSIRVDNTLSDDLAVIMRTGGTATDAVRAAVAHLAEIYRTAWANGVVPDGVTPTVLAYQLQQRRTPRAPLTSRNGTASDTRQTPRTGYPLPGGQPRRSAGPVVTPPART